MREVGKEIITIGIIQPQKERKGQDQQKNHQVFIGRMRIFRFCPETKGQKQSLYNTDDVYN